jgi:Predicted acetyltransferase
MKIELIRKEHFEEIRDIDLAAFSREVPRSIENIEALVEANPSGSFAAIENGKVVGFLFSKLYGGEGCIGPLGVHPDFQDRGFGRELIKAGIAYLKQKCSVIGLEVNPAILKNIYLYNSMGFITAFLRCFFKPLPWK